MIRHFDLTGAEIDPTVVRPERIMKIRTVSEGAKTMQMRAIVTFQSRYGFIRTGEVFTAEDGYAQQLRIGGKAVYEPEERKPDRTQHFPAAPEKKTDDPVPSTPPPSESERPKVSGTVQPSALSRAVRRLTKKTPTTRGTAAK
jgi:hypothetical protein